MLTEVEDEMVAGAERPLVELLRRGDGLHAPAAEGGGILDSLDDLHGRARALVQTRLERFGDLDPLLPLSGSNRLSLGLEHGLRCSV